jgi:hypothetical protein
VVVDHHKAPGELERILDVEPVARAICPIPGAKPARRRLAALVRAARDGPLQVNVQDDLLGPGVYRLDPLAAVDQLELLAHDLNVAMSHAREYRAVSLLLDRLAEPVVTRAPDPMEGDVRTHW